MSALISTLAVLPLSVGGLGTSPAYAAAGDVSTLAGSGVSGFADGPAAAAQFSVPVAVAVDGSGNLYVADNNFNSIRKISSVGMVTTLVGPSSGGFADGPAATAMLLRPEGVAVDGSGNVYVADSGNNRIRKIDAFGVVSTLAGSGGYGFADGVAAAAQFAYPRGVAVDGSGNVYVADMVNARIRKIDSLGVVSTLAGTGGWGWRDGPAATAMFNLPEGVALDGLGNVYVADTSNNLIRKIDASGVVSSLQGQFGLPTEVAVDGLGNVYVADSANNRIRKVDSLGVVSTLAGTGVYGFADGSAATAKFARPNGVALDGLGNVYVADTNSHRIRKIETTNALPTTTTVATTTTTTQPATTTTQPASTTTQPASTTTQPATTTTAPTTTTTTTVPAAPPVKAVRVLGVSIYSDATTKSGLIGTFADPVNGATGAFTHEVQDVSVASKGFEFSMGRLYDSKSTKTSPLGTAWGSKLFESIAVSSDPAAIPGTLVWKSGTGTEAEFAPDGLGGFVTPPGSLGVIRATAGGGWEYVSAAQVVTRFDVAGRKVSSLDRSGQGLTYTYDLAGKLTTVTNASGQATLFAYGTAASNPNKDLLIKVTTSDLRIVKYGYTANIAGKPRLTSVTDVRNKISTYAYDAQGLLVSETDPVGNKPFLNFYDAQGRVVWQDDPLGKRSTFAYNDAQQITTMTDAAGAVQSQNYSGNVLGRVSTPAGSSVIVRNSALDVTAYTDAAGKSWAAQYDARGNMTSRTGPTGLVETWTYDSGNNVLTQTDTTGVLTSYGYDASGRVVSEVKDGQQRSYNWNVDGTLASSSDPLGRLTAYTYDPLGRMTTQTSPGGGVTAYEYDAAGRMTRMIPPRGNVAGADPAVFDMLYKYDKAGNQTNVQGPGVRTVSVYDDANRLITKTEADGGITSYVYNAAGEVTSMTGPDGGVTTYEYSNRGERIAQVDPVGAKTTWTYDGAGRMVNMVEPRGNVAGANPTDYQWSYGYDAVGRKISETDPLGRVSFTTYDALGRATNQTRPDGSTATVFDPVLQERKVTTTDQAGRSSITELDALGRVVKTTDARGFVTQSTYDAVGNRLSQTAPDGGVTTWTYDSENRVTSMVDPRGNTPPALPAAFTTTYAYDIEGHQVSSTDPLGRVTQTVFDTAGRADTTTDPGGKITNLAYDAVGRVRQVNQTGQGATKYTYDTAGNLRTRIDPLLRNTLYDYDLGRRLVKQTDPAGRFSTFGYDLEGRRTLMVDQKAHAAGNPALGSTSYTYDRLGRVLGRSYSDGTAAVSYSYDAAGRRATMVDGTGTTTYSYDSANRVMSKTLPSGAVMAYTYDAASNVLTASDGSGGTATRTYDQVGRLKTVIDEAGNVTTYGYDTAGFLVSTVLPGGVRQDRVVDAAGQIGQIANSGSAGLIRSFQYTRDGSGNPTAVIANGPAGVLEAQSQLFTYDNANRLRRACWTAVACKNANQTAWTYDVVGKRLTEKVGAAPAKTLTYNGQTDELTQTVDGAQITNFVYDANGNQTQNGNAKTSMFNAAGQTVSVVEGAPGEASVSSTYSYDGDGLRVSEVLNQFGNVTTTKFDWDTVSSGLANVVADHRTGSNGVNNNRFTYGLGLVSSEASDHVRSFGLTDPLGTLTQSSAVDGAIRWNGSTNPFGEIHDETFAPGNTALYGEELRRYRFTGQYEAGFGLTYMRARNYNASLGAFTQTDPLQADVGSAYPSAYVYGNNNPLRFTDPNGLRSVGGHGDGRGVSGDPGPVVMLASLHQDVNIPGTNKCLLFPFGKTKCAPKKLSDATKAKIDDLGTDFLETMAEAGGFQKSAKSVAALDTFSDCVLERSKSDCTRNLVLGAIDLAGGGGAALTILAGPAQMALFKLVDTTTNFVKMQATVAVETLDGNSVGKPWTISRIGGQEGMRYWVGRSYLHVKGFGKEFWTAT